jgi:predicted secreted protein
MECIYDDTTAQLALGAFQPDTDTALRVEFYPNDGAGKKFAGNVIVTSVSRTASFDDLVTVTVNFQGTGPLNTDAYNT